MRVDRVKYRLICAASGAIMLTLAACGKKEQPPGAGGQQPPTQVGVITVQPQAVAVNTELPGRASSYLVAEVHARVDGIVLKRYFQQGAEVKAGQILFQIDPAPYQASLMSAKATLAKAEATLRSAQAQADRYKTLVAANAVSKQQYDDALATLGSDKADVESGRASVRTAEINLGYCTVRAPISGRIGSALVTEGAYVQGSAATNMALVQQISPVYIDLTQSSDQLLRLRRSIETGALKEAGANAAKVQVVLSDGTTLPDVGKLEFTDVSVDQGTGTTTVRAVFPNVKRDLLPGMFVRARIQQAINDNAFVVPMQGVTHDQKGAPIAMVVDANNKVQMRPLQTSQALGSSWVVTGGLQAGDRVIVEGTQKVQPGATVQPVDAKLPPASKDLEDTSGAMGGKDGAAAMAASSVIVTSPASGASSAAPASAASEVK
ncbi:hemolysin D [Robbsia andropogonis]|uniref:Hemolysin D n=1 Tax=Robbsia andropogonis TaxID=28092 RepID=A0A0F5K1Q7_9BURK|nr:efflux RND transporter periplasmic adaptor subunit [Robbsia andropogonis]KKB63819.1 hemolysin D [Robbsia andropogonis]